MICTAKGRSSYHEMLQAFDLFWSSKLLCFFQWQMSDHFLSRVRRLLQRSTEMLAVVNTCGLDQYLKN